MSAKPLYMFSDILQLKLTYLCRLMCWKCWISSWTIEVVVDIWKWYFSCEMHKWIGVHYRCTVAFDHKIPFLDEVNLDQCFNDQLFICAIRMHDHAYFMHNHSFCYMKNYEKILDCVTPYTNGCIHDWNWLTYKCAFTMNSCTSNIDFTQIWLGLRCMTWHKWFLLLVNLFIKLWMVMHELHA